jgi:hypothetical protein
MSPIMFLQRYYNLYYTLINHFHEYMLLYFIANLYFKCFLKYISSDFLGGCIVLIVRRDEINLRNVCNFFPMY